MNNQRQGGRYIIMLGGTIISVLALCLLVNIVMDPLWYFEGNLIANENFAFNERESKVNRFLKYREQYNCLIFGSSRTTLLDETLIKKYNCNNFAFSNGVIEEFIGLGKYIKELGFYPKIIILGVDDINFIKMGLPVTIPDFIEKGKRPPYFYEVYLTLDALDLSKRLFSHRSPVPRYYDEEFVGKILPDPPRYTPAIIKRDDIILKEGAVVLYREFREMFLGSVFVGYVPPISAWKMASKGEKELVNYLKSIYEISGFVSPMYDFSLVSDITRNSRNTYDGSHFSTAINKLIVDRINGESGRFGIRVDYFEGKENYIRKFRQSVEQFSETLIQD